jgi:hypothetical protein
MPILSRWWCEQYGRPMSRDARARSRATRALVGVAVILAVLALVMS